MSIDGLNFFTFLGGEGLYSSGDVQQMVKEIVKMKDLTHCHVMSLIGVCLDTNLAIIMPYMANGSVLDYLKKEKEKLVLSEYSELDEVCDINLFRSDTTDFTHVT